MRVEREDTENKVKGESIGVATISNTTIPLPYSAITTTEVNYAEEITDNCEVEVIYPNKIHELKERWNLNSIRRLMNSDAQFEAKVAYLKIQKEKSPAEIFIYTPLLKEGTPITREVVDFFIKLQIKAEFDIINILDIPYFTFQQMRELLTTKKRELEDQNKIPFLLASTKTPDMRFKPISKLAVELLNGLTAIYANPMQNFSNFSTLAGLQEPNFIRLLSNVDRIFYKDNKSAIMPNAYLYSDIFSSKLGMYVTKKKLINGKMEVINTFRPRLNARRLDKISGGLLKIRQQRTEHDEDLDCVCPIDRGNTLSDVVVDFNKYLYKAFRVHEPFAIYEDLESVRERINRGNLLEFINTKKYAKNVLDSVFGVGQQILAKATI